jgi:hypothetical protein
MNEPPSHAPAPVASRHKRPWLVTIVGAGWLVLAPLLLARCLWLFVQPQRPASLQTLAVLGSIALLAGALGSGLWQLRPWARLAQILVAIPLICFGYTTLGALALLVYFSRPETKACFQGGRAATPCWHTANRGWQDSEITWVVTAIVLGVGGFIGCAIVFAHMAERGFMR